MRRGVQAPPDDDVAADIYLLAADRPSTSAGYEQYEISNWSRPGFQCRHNLVYWRHEPYLGFGPGAHSFDGRRRWWNVRPVPQYIQRVNAGESPERDGEPIDERLAMGEFMMLGLRLVARGRGRTSGSAAVSARTCPISLAIEIEDLVSRGLLERLPDRVRLTTCGAAPWQPGLRAVPAGE